MKPKLQLVIALAFLFFVSATAFSAEQTTAADDLKDLVGKIQAKLKEGQKTQSDLADELKQFDTLMAKHKGETNDEVAQILFMKAMLYKQVLHNTDEANTSLQQLKKDFPDSAAVKSVKSEEEAAKVQESLVEGSKFPDFDEKDVAGKAISIGAYKGKVVLVDFWATWCGPCVMELPNVLETYKKHHPKGFEIVGISLDQSKEKLTNFTASKEMPWQQFFDGKGWSNKLAVRYGIHSIPMTYLLDQEGKIIGKGLRGEDLENAVEKALAKK
jgi:thiol-disulfide isomerase/thioredoxin